MISARSSLCMLSERYEVSASAPKRTVNQLVAHIPCTRLVKRYGSTLSMNLQTMPMRTQVTACHTRIQCHPPALLQQHSALPTNKHLRPSRSPAACITNSTAVLVCCQPLRYTSRISSCSSVLFRAHSRNSRASTVYCRYRESDSSAETSSATQNPPTSSSSTPSASTPHNPVGTVYRGTAVVVGAGPAGSTAAMYLARSGYRVHVIERRGHPGQVEADIKRTYLIGLGERGLGALDGLGITVPLSVGRPMKGSVYAYKSGKRIEDPFTPATRIIGVDRQGLAAFLVDQAQQQFPEAVTFHWHTQPTGFNLRDKTINCGSTELTTNNTTTITSSSSGSSDLPAVLPYDLLVGADGAASGVRAALVDAVPGMKVEQLTSPVAEMEYKAFHNLPWNNAIRSLLPKYSSSPDDADSMRSAQAAAAAPPSAAAQAARKEAAAAAVALAATVPGTPAAAAAEAAAKAPPAAAEEGQSHGLGEGMTFFAFNNPQPNQPSPGSITLYLNASGLWSGTVYQPPGKYEAMHGDVAAHEAAIQQFTPPTFPEEWVPEMAQQMADIQPSRINPMRLVSDLTAPTLGVVLLGDAAHNVTPQMGQGCNSALEDAALLDKALSSSNYNISAGLQHFQQQRRPQVHALQHMEEENSWVRRPARIFQDPVDKTLARFAWISFFMLLPLLRLLPGMKQYVHASLFQTIMSTTIPYNKLHRAIRVAPFVVLGLLGGVVYGLQLLVRQVFGL